MISSCFYSALYSGSFEQSLQNSQRTGWNVSLQFQGQASLFSERSAPGRDALIHTGDRRTMRSILTTALLEDCDRNIYRKPSFMFGDTAPDTDHQLLAGEGQWIFNLDGEKYYLPSSKRHFRSLSSNA